MKNKYVYLVQDKDTLINYGVFSTEKKALKYTSGSNNLAIQEVKVI